MKKIGILGGMGPEASIDYYKSIVSYFHEKNKNLSVPEIVLYSVDITQMFRMVSEQQWAALTDWLLEKLEYLKNAGAEFAAISANTPHIVFDLLQPRSPLPLLSIVEATAKYVKMQGFRKPALLGTKFTMQAPFFAERFAKESMTIVVPNEQEQDCIQEKLVNEIELGIFKDGTREAFLSIIRRMKEHETIDCVILGCTELPLILQQHQSDVPLINTSAIHVRAICDYCLQEKVML